MVAACTNASETDAAALALDASSVLGANVNEVHNACCYMYR